MSYVLMVIAGSIIGAIMPSNPPIVEQWRFWLGIAAVFCAYVAGEIAQ